MKVFNLLFLMLVLNLASSNKLISSLTNFELLFNFILREKEALIDKLSKLVWVNNFKALYGSKILNSFHVLSPDILRSFKEKFISPKELVFLLVKLNSKFISFL